MPELQFAPAGRPMDRGPWKTATARFLALVLTGLLGAGHAAGASGETDWNFRALLDGKPIGSHRFSLSPGPGDERTLVSEADFAVKILGLTAYRYHHRATEHWRGDSLTDISASTDDDGKVTTVHLGPEALSAGAMSFAYWNPKIQTRTRLLNAQTGRFENVQISRVGAGTLSVRGVPVPAVRWRITGAKQPIDVWYSDQGEWIGLDSVVDGAHKLSYRLE
jgi:hypothetical protein